MTLKMKFALFSIYFIIISEMDFIYDRLHSRNAHVTTHVLNATVVRCMCALTPLRLSLSAYVRIVVRTFM